MGTHITRRTIAIFALVVVVLSAGCFAGGPFVNRGFDDGPHFREVGAERKFNYTASNIDTFGNGRAGVYVTNIHFDRPIRMQRTVPSMGNRGNNLFINRGNGTFTTKERAYGIRDGGWGWAAALVDLDNDGDRDLVHTTNNYLSDSHVTENIQEIETRPRIWKRTGGNFTRLNATRIGFETSSGRGLAHLDYDLDGDQDLVVATHDGEFKLYENHWPNGNWLQFALEGDGSPVLGSRVFVIAPDRTQYRVVNAKADFLSQDTRTLHFGLGDHDTVTVRVIWPDGTERTLESISVNQRLVIQRNGTVESVWG